jgi:uncharacterized protein
MYLELKEMGPEGVSFDRVLALPALDGTGGERVEVVAARVSGSARPGSRGVLFHAHLEAPLEMPCSRCLEPVRQDVSSDFDRTLVPVESEDAEVAVGDDEDETLMPVVGARAELEAIATEQLYLSLPLKPICSIDCRGLCPRCGANRNAGACGCVVEDVDPRLAPLLQFKRTEGPEGPRRG